MSKRKPATENVTVTNKLQFVPDCQGAADLFSRILGAVREQTAEERRAASRQERERDKSAA